MMDAADEEGPGFLLDAADEAPVDGAAEVAEEAGGIAQGIADGLETAKEILVELGEGIKEMFD